MVSKLYICISEDFAKSPEEADEEEDTVSKEERGQTEDMLEEPVVAPLEPSEDGVNIAEDNDAQKDGSVEKEENDTMDEFVENVLGTSVSDETVQENNDLVPEDGMATGLVEGVPGIIDVRGSVDTDINLAEYDNDDKELESPAKGLVDNLVEDIDTQDSITETNDKSKDDINKEASEMSQMQALYGESSEESNNAEGSGESDSASREVPDINECLKDTDEVIDDSHKLESNEDNVLDSDNANIIDTKNETDNNKFDNESEMEADPQKVESNTNEDNSSENITSDVHEESGETTYDNKVTEVKDLDAHTEQMEVDDAEENKTEKKDTSNLGEESATKYDNQTGSAISGEQVSTESDLTKANNNEDSGEMVSESLKDTSQEMTEADEAKLLEPTEEEQKGT